jgi:3-oxoacyl-[acyl-carrier protein] reductase
LQRDTDRPDPPEVLLMRDWSLDPRLRAVLGRLPLPITLPTPLQRHEGPTPAQLLPGTPAVLTRLRDALDLGLATAFLRAGARLVVVDPAPQLPLPTGARHEPWDGELPDGLLASVRGQSREPTVLVHRPVLPPDATDPARHIETDRLFSVLHASAHLPRNSRLLLVFGDDLQTGEGPLLQALAAGALRSAHKELGRIASTAHVLRQGGSDPEALADTAVFLAGRQAAFLTGLDLTLHASVSTADSLGLHGKVALVTGGARGIGAAIAQRLAQEGAEVWINDLSAAALPADGVIAAIQERGGQAHFLGADIATEAGALAIADALRHGPGHVDVVVHNAGITRDKTLRKMSLAQWRLVLQVDFGAMVRVQAALDPLVRTGGSLVLLSSVMGIAGNFGQANYTAAKAAVIALAEQWGRTGLQRGVRANAIAPGFILTEMTAHLPLLNREMAKQLTALLQPGDPMDVAELACFLARTDSRGITGQVLRCDGGMAFGK